MKPILIPILAFFLLFPVTACKAKDDTAAQAPAQEQTAEDHVLPVEKLIIEKKDGSKKFGFNVEIATQPQEVMRGLMFRDSMAEDHGMLFIFGAPRQRNFWMKNTHIPLDIIYIKEDGTIGHIAKNAIPFDETPLPSVEPALTVLEINGGLSDKLGISDGDMVYMAPQPKTVAP